MKKYIIKHFIDYVGNGCDCCEPTPFDAYHVKDVETGKYFGYEDEDYGFIVLQYASREEALEAILEKLGVEVEYEYQGEEDENF